MAVPLLKKESLITPAYLNALNTPKYLNFPNFLSFPYRNRSAN